MNLLIIGFDGATFNLIRPWAAAGYLPNLARMMQVGVHRELHSTLPPVTSPAWPTFMTGCNPGKHGVFDFIQPMGSRFKLVNSTSIKQPTIWQRLSQAGYRVGVMNVPVTYPPQEVNGFMITGMLSPTNGRISHPADLISRYEAQLGPYQVLPKVQYKPGNEEEFIAEIYRVLHLRGQWALELMQREAWDVLMVHFLAMDIMKHALWRFMDSSHPRYEASPYEHAIRDGYAIVDSYIGQLLNQLPAGGNALIMSDHGFGPLNQMVNLNVFLWQKGLLKLKQDAWTQLKAFAFRHGITPFAAFQLASKIGVQNLAAQVSKEQRNNIVGKFLSFDNVDWSRTMAYSMGHMGQVYLNLAGREPEGIVGPEEYEQARQQVIDVLQGLQDANGRSLVSHIYTREDAYHGPYAANGADLHLVLDDYNMIAFPLFATEGKVLTQQIRGDSGCHRSEGIFLGYGPDICAAGEQLRANILDLAPTIMHMMGTAVPRIMDGQVLQDIFVNPTAVTYSDDEEALEASTSPGFNAEEEAQVEERLRGLGYL